MRFKKSRLLIMAKWILLMIFAFFFEFCSNDNENTKETISEGTPVHITHPKIMDFTEYINLNANTAFLEKEIVRSTFQGFIEKIHKNIGDKIHPGDILATIKTKESVANDSIKLNLGDKTFRGYVKITAHSAGVLTVLNYHSGDFISEGEQLAVISNPSTLIIMLNVPYAYVSGIVLKSSCEIILPDGEKFPAVIQKIIPSIDPVAQTETFLLVPQDKINLPENLNIIARIPLKTIQNACILPRSAILSNETQDRFWVMKLTNNSTAIQVFIKKGIEDDSLVQIIHPAFTPADKIVTDGGFGLPDSAKVLVNKQL